MRIKKSLLAALAATLALGSCTDFINGFDAKSHEYKVNFEKQFGEIDPNQDWSMAAQTVANVNMPEIKGDAVVTIFNGNPNMFGAKVLGKSSLKNGVGSFNFYSVKGINDVYVQINQNGKTTLLDNYAIENGNVYVGKFSTRSFSDECPTTLADRVEKFMTITSTIGGTTQHGWTFYQTINGQHTEMGFWTNFNDCAQAYVDYGVAQGWSDAATVASWQNLEKDADGKWVCTSNSGTFAEIDKEDGGETTTVDINLQYLNNVETEAASPWTRGWGYSLYGPGGFFMEQEYYYGQKTSFDKTTLYGDTEEEKLAMLKKIEDGFSITSTGGTIELPFIYGSTQIIDQFGYVIYDEDEDPLTKPHYILMEDGRPDVNIYQNAWGNGAETGFSGTSISSWVTDMTYNLQHRNDPITCNCTHGTGIWSEPYGTGEEGVHEDYCPAKTDNTATCTCTANGVGSGVYSPTGQHTIGCQDPMKPYLEMYNTKVYGTKYRLVYFDNDGNSSYYIPAGKKIVFFICPVSSKAGLTNRTGYNKNDFHYSLPELNRRIEHYYWNKNSLSYQRGVQTDKSGAVKACSWVSDGKTFLGFEDGGRDEDLNDIIFLVDGNFTTDDQVKLEPIKWHMNTSGNSTSSTHDLYFREDKVAGTSYNEPSGTPRNGKAEFLGWATTPDATEGVMTISGTTPLGGIDYYAIWSEPLTETPQSWIFACEDLGGSFDYDFNDVVWEVTQVTTEQGNSVFYGDIQVKILAAGGTLPIKLVYASNVVGGEEIHSKAFGQTIGSDGKYTPVNVSKGGLIAPVLLGTIPANGQPMSLETLKSNFKLMVSDAVNGDGEYIDAMRHGNADDKTPQILILPDTWRWPLEYKGIDTAYPQFSNWVKNSLEVDWMSYKNEDVLINR